MKQYKYYFWLQMCWHRQRIIIPGQKASSPSLNAYHHLRFAYCAKVLGYLKVDNSSILCRFCYERLLSTYHRLCYSPLFYHFISDGLHHPVVICKFCSESVLTLRILRECNDCTQEHLHFLTIDKIDLTQNVHS